MTEEGDFGLLKCINCKNYNGHLCTIDDKKVEGDTECFNGQYEPIDVKVEMKDCYDNISYFIDYYMDVPEDIKNIICLWVIGTHFHNNFETFPYLFINAMRGSGKTRLLKIIAEFSDKGYLTNKPTESIMFRTKGTLCIDEFEGVMGKDKDASLKELLNSGYKKGITIFRSRKKKGIEGEEFAVEEFQPYRPIVMANIWGMEEVLGDRCISFVLEKSIDPSKIKLIEDFKDHPIIHDFKTTLNLLVKCSLCRCSLEKNINKKWNEYVKSIYTTLNTYNTYYNRNNIKNITTEEIIKEDFIIEKDHDTLFKKINESEIDGRNLELFFPLFLIAEELGDEEILDKTIEFAKYLTKQRKIEEVTESVDVAVYSLVSTQEANVWKDVSGLIEVFRLMSGGHQEWMTAKWLGRALKRLNLVKDKRRLGSGVQVMLDVNKAKLKEMIFRPKEDGRQETETIINSDSNE